MPPFLPSEAAIRPLTQWATADLQALVDDASDLADSDEPERAVALLARWLHDLDIGTLVDRLPDATKSLHGFNGHDNRLGEAASFAFEKLGRLSAILGWPFYVGEAATDVKVAATVAFEKGVVRRCYRESFRGYDSRTFCRPTAPISPELGIHVACACKSGELAARTGGVRAAGRVAIEA